MDSKNLVIISIGDEILSGRTINTNASYLSRAFSSIGIKTLKHIAAGDRKGDIADTVIHYMKAADIIIITGGIGPTDDDITVESVADALGQNLTVSSTLKQGFMKRLNNEQIAVKLATVMENAELLENGEGLAYGQHINVSDTDIFILPGVPGEVRDITENRIITKYESTGCSARYLRTSGIYESDILKELRNSSSASAERIALLPFAGGVDIVLYEPSKGDYSRLQDIFSEYIYSRAMDESLSERVGAMLTEKGLTLSTAESCTAGLVSKLITDVPGSSQYFKGGVTAYSNEIKLRILDVDSEILDKHGAVSRQTAEAMAQGIRRLMKSDIGISVTGIAGPGGGTDDKPAGLVYMAVAFNKTTSFKYIFNGSRSSNRNFSAHYLLFNLYRRLR